MRLLLFLALFMLMSIFLNAYKSVFSPLGSMKSTLTPYNFNFFLQTANPDQGEFLELEEIKKYSMAYPSPLSLSHFFSHKTAQEFYLFYYLDAAKPVWIYVYNALGTEIAYAHFLENSQGAKTGVNQISLHPNMLNLRRTSPGIYFYLICAGKNQQVLYKGKIAVQP